MVSVAAVNEIEPIMKIIELVRSGIVIGKGLTYGLVGNNLDADNRSHGFEDLFQQNLLNVGVKAADIEGSMIRFWSGATDSSASAHWGSDATSRRRRTTWTHGTRDWIGVEWRKRWRGHVSRGIVRAILGLAWRALRDGSGRVSHFEGLESRKESKKAAFIQRNLLLFL